MAKKKQTFSKQMEKEKINIINSLHMHVNQFNEMSDEEFRERICHGLSNEEFLDEILFINFKLKTLIFNNLKMTGEHLSKQVIKEVSDEQKKDINNAD